MSGADKMKRNIYIGILALILLTTVIISAGNVAYGENNNKRVEVLFTHDIHSYLASYTDTIDGVEQNVGGMARLATVIQQKKANGSDPLVVDGGDIAMGTLYQALYTEEAPELRILGQLGFDATTFGNHDFDYSDEKLAQMFMRAAESGDRLPAFCVSNIDWNCDNDSTRKIYKEASKCNLCEYAVVEKNGVKIAIMGIFGKSATEDSPTLKLKVDDQIEAAKATVARIKENENVDMIVCLSHSGTSADFENSEDEQLAINVPEIDVIVSAHSHTTYYEPLIYGNTCIVSCGCYGKNTGYVSLTQNDEGRWSVENYDLIAMSEDIEEDETVKEAIAAYDDKVDDNYLRTFEMTSDQVLAYSPYSFESVDDMYRIKGEHVLGNFMSDAYRYAARASGNEADVAVVPAGTVRGTIYKGDITVKDAFMCYSLGMGYDNQVGFPLVRFYLSGSELKLISEVDASLSDIMNEARLYASGVSYSIGTKRMFLNRAYDIYCNPDVMDDTREEIDDSKMYAVVTDLYTARMLGSVTRISRGLIKIEPKYADGTLVESDADDYLWEKVVLYNDEGREIKAWVGIADYLQSFEQNDDGVRVIPEYYGTLHDRKILSNKLSVRNTNRYFWIIVGITVLVLAIIIVLVITAVRGIRALRARKNKKAGLTKN